MATEVDVAVIGGGAAGLAAARAASRRGRRTLLVSDGELGGECTFSGCVPSKTLIEAASQGLGFDEALERMRAVIARIAATENEEVLAREGIEVLRGRARFCGRRILSVNGRSVKAKRVIIATGSYPALPPIPGLDAKCCLTNETVFQLTSLPRSIAVLGGGAIGCELAQAFRRFGARVELIEAEDRLLPRGDPEAGTVLARVFAAEGINLHLGKKVERVEWASPGVGVRLSASAGSLRADLLLVAVGRRPATADLNAEEAGVELDERGFVRVDQHLASSAPGVYAAGDVTGRMLFTHAADEMGRLAVRNAFAWPLRSSFPTQAVPWVTFTDPEVAQVGVTEADSPPGALVAVVPMSGVDRALTAGRSEGFVKLIAAPRHLLGHAGGGKLVGATVVAPRAGEMIHEAALAIRTQMFTGRLAQTVHAYPTWSTAIRLAAAQFFFEVDGRRARPASRGRSDAQLPAPSLEVDRRPGTALQHHHLQAHRSEPPVLS